MYTAFSHIYVTSLVIYMIFMSGTLILYLKKCIIVIFIVNIVCWKINKDADTCSLLKKKDTKLEKKTTADKISIILFLGNVCRLTQHVHNKHNQCTIKGVDQIEVDLIINFEIQLAIAAHAYLADRAAHSHWGSRQPSGIIHQRRSTQWGILKAAILDFYCPHK